jgi:hypothetical protein
MKEGGPFYIDSYRTQRTNNQFSVAVICAGEGGKMYYYRIWEREKTIDCYAVLLVTLQQQVVITY